MALMFGYTVFALFFNRSLPDKTIAVNRRNNRNNRYSVFICDDGYDGINDVTLIMAVIFFFRITEDIAYTLTAGIISLNQHQ